ncbi:hypothetical protein L7F22_008538 [Adiantum nelumboides]|nr:hypothetical protein [Adiantum nelumboides]
MLKQHFQFFGDVVSVELEDFDRQGESNFTEKATAKVTFSTRIAAEKAYAQGRWLQGTTLQFNWVNPPSNTSNVPSSDKVHVEVKDSMVSCSKNENGSEDRTHTSIAGNGCDMEGGCEMDSQLKTELVATRENDLKEVSEEVQLSPLPAIVEL